MDSMLLLFCILLAHYEDLEPSNIRVQYLWEALTNFTNGESAQSFFVGNVGLVCIIVFFFFKISTSN